MQASFFISHLWGTDQRISYLDFGQKAQISSLFQRERSVITRHINNVFKEGELEKESNVHFLHIANSDKPVQYYSLDVK